MIPSARFDDLAEIVPLHHDEAGGDVWTNKTRPLYEAAFREIVGTCQIVLIRGLTGGGLRAKLEAVRVRADRRSRGFGRELLTFAENAAREAGASEMELTSAKQRARAHRFYSREGYAATHEGLRKRL